MRLLLDTYVVIKLLAEPERLPSAVLQTVGEAEAVLFSAVNPWEIEIKVQLGKLRRPDPDVTSALRGYGFHELPIVSAYAAAVGRLPLHHRDPFDRMLAAQALTEHLTLVTSDEIFGRYGVSVLRC